VDCAATVAVVARVRASALQHLAQCLRKPPVNGRFSFLRRKSANNPQ
jgi:hypothetical protein